MKSLAPNMFAALLAEASLAKNSEKIATIVADNAALTNVLARKVMPVKESSDWTMWDAQLKRVAEILKRDMMALLDAQLGVRTRQCSSTLNAMEQRLREYRASVAKTSASNNSNSNSSSNIGAFFTHA